MMGGLPSINRPRQPRAGLPGRHPIEWARLVALAALAAALLWALVQFGPRLRDPDQAASHPEDSFSALVEGYDGPPVEVTVVGERTRALDGLCIAIVRDASSSVSSGIDPDSQVNKELATISEAFARGGLPADQVAGVVFASEARSSGLVDPGDSGVREVLLGSPGEDGTSFSAGLSTAAASLGDCPAGAAREVILVSDGESSTDDITGGLAALPDGTSVHLVALDGGGWTRIVRDWGVVGAEATVVRRLDGGVVAMAVNRVMSELTGQNFTTGFDMEGNT